MKKICHHCLEPIVPAQVSEHNPDLHRFCYELVVGELAEQLEETALEMGATKLPNGKLLFPNPATEER